MRAPVLFTKITAPQLPIRTLQRRRVTDRLLNALDFRVTLLQAGAGYGKSTALASLNGEQFPLVWYQVGDEDDDALVFLQHLCHASRLAFPGIRGLPLPALEAWDLSAGAFSPRDIVVQFLNALAGTMEGQALLVLDDAHRVSDNPLIADILDQLITHAPQGLHFLLSSRTPLSLQSLPALEARGQVLRLSQRILVFTAEEIAELFADRYEFELTPDEVRRIHHVTEGWAITLQLIWQSLRVGSLAFLSADLSRPPDLDSSDAPLENLFRLLAQDVLSAQPEDVRRFLIVTATLRTMTVASCDALLGAGRSAETLRYLRSQELFVVPVDADTLRYHHIFHRFLRQQSDPAERQTWHHRAGEHYRTTDDPDSAIYHFLKAAEFDRAAELLVEHGEWLLASGRLDTLVAYLDAVPPARLAHRPALLFYLGDIARLRNRYEEALGWYGQAETLWRDRGQADGIARALRGQARIYLDTVNPARAEDLLQQSLRLTDGTSDREAQARLYELLAENKLNSGKPAEAEQLRQQAEAMRLEGPSDSQLPYRIMLRTGRLAEAQALLETRLQAEREEPVHTPRAHRETHFILSLIYAFQGKPDSALAIAEEGTERGARLGSPYMTAVGHMRQGHALMLLPGENRYAEARAHFQEAVQISRALSVPRLRVEAYWGLCRAHGYQGGITQALEFARNGIEIATQAGDEWVASLTRLAMGASLVLAGRYDAAEDWLNQARRGMEACADPYGALAARLWLVVHAHRKEDAPRVDALLPELLSVGKERGELDLFTRPTLIGLPDERMFVPLLLRARAEGWEAAFADDLLRRMGLGEIRFHPGYRLNVHTLGRFVCELGSSPIPDSGWRRQATRSLWQLFVNFRGTPLDREQIFEYLWPGNDPESSQRNFKVALNTLYKVIEPDRPPGGESAFIYREGTLYGIRNEADIWIDAEAFLQAVEDSEALADAPVRDQIDALESASGLYGGEYLPDARYETWSAAERELLAVQYLKATDRLTELYLSSGHPERAIEAAQRILAQDNCWERAYRHLMRAYHQLGDRGQLGRVYRRCVEALMQELDVPPSTETEALFRQLTGPVTSP